MEPRLTDPIPTSALSIAANCLGDIANDVSKARIQGYTKVRVNVLCAPTEMPRNSQVDRSPLGVSPSMVDMLKDYCRWNKKVGKTGVVGAKHARLGGRYIRTVPCAGHNIRRDDADRPPLEKKLELPFAFEPSGCPTQRDEGKRAERAKGCDVGAGGRGNPQPG